MLAIAPASGNQPIHRLDVPLPRLRNGERAIGTIVSTDGGLCNWLILLPDESEAAGWRAQMDWAASIGGHLPGPTEFALLADAMPALSETGWLWTRKCHSYLATYAHALHFASGVTHPYYYFCRFPARAVRSEQVAPRN